MSRIVIVGGGQAGSSLAVKLRALGYDGEIIMLCAEPVPPYQRPPLSKAYLLGEMERERLYLRPEAFYADQGIDLRLGTRATAIEHEARVVRLEGDEWIEFDQLALTTGAHPRQLPSAIGGDLDGVYTVRDLADIDALEPEVLPGRRALVVGGGYIGLEAAAVLRKKGLEVVLIEAADRILQRVAAPQTSDWFRALHQGKGVDIREGVGLARLVGTDRVEAAELADGTRLEIDLCVAGIGIAPATVLAEASGIACDSGITTDQMGQTSAKGVWAAGDCASLPYRGEQIRLESVQNAIDQAEAVAANMLGADEPYTAMPWFWSDQYDVTLQIAGLNRGYDSVVVRDAGDGRSHWYYRGTELLAVDAMGAPRAYMVGKRLIEAGKSPSPDVIVDPETELKALLKA